MSIGDWHDPMSNPVLTTGTVPWTEVQTTAAEEQFATGSVRGDRAGKGRYDLLPPEALHRYAVHMENGAKVYGDRNWEKGQPISRYLDSALRHLFKYLLGLKDEDHLAAAFWNIGAALTTEERVNNGTLPSELADLPWMEN